MSNFPTGLQHVALYLRKSRADVESEARGEGETLSRHRSALLKVANAHRYGIDDVYEEIVSGERIVDRPEMQRLLHAVGSQKYSAVLCMDLDRLGRGNQIDQGLIQETFKESKTLIITPRKVYDLQDEMDEEWSEFEAFMARRELKIITRRMQRGRWQSAAEGKHIGKKPPYGYLRDENLNLYPDPDTAFIVRQMFRLSADGLGSRAIAAYLAEHGIKSPTGSDVWDTSTISSILENPVYRGHIRWGYKRQKKTPDGSKRFFAPEEEWQICENAHEALVDEETYQRHLEKISKRPKVKLSKELSNPFAGLIYCAKCGYVMRRRPRHQRPHDMLLCVRPGCDNRSTHFDLAEERILQTLQQITADMAVRDSMASKAEPESDNAIGIAEYRVNQLKTELEQTEKQLGNLHDLLERGAYTVEVFLERSRVLGNRIDELKQQLKDAEANLEQTKKRTEKQISALPQLMHVLEMYHQAESVKEKNDLLHTVVEKIVYHRDQSWKDVDHFEIDIFLRI